MFELFLHVLIWLWLEMLLPNIQPKQDLYTIIYIFNTLHCAPLKSLSVLSTFFSLKQMFCLVTNESLLVVGINGLYCAVSAFLTMMVCVLRCGILRLLPLGDDGGCHGNHRAGAPHT